MIKDFLKLKLKKNAINPKGNSNPNSKRDMTGLIAYLAMIFILPYVECYAAWFPIMMDDCGGPGAGLAFFLILFVASTICTIVLMFTTSIIMKRRSNPYLNRFFDKAGYSVILLLFIFVSYCLTTKYRYNRVGDHEMLLAGYIALCVILAFSLFVRNFKKILIFTILIFVFCFIPLLLSRIGYLVKELATIWLVMTRVHLTAICITVLWRKFLGFIMAKLQKLTKV